MRILHLADLHLDRPFVGMPRVAARRRRLDLRAAFERGLAVGRARDVHLITIAGDLWEDEHVTTDTRAFVARSLERAALPVLLIAGNHDPLLPGGHHDRTPWPANVRLVRSGTLTEHRYGPASVWAVSWLGGRLSLAGLAEFRMPDDGRAHLLLVHGTARPAALPALAPGDEYAPFDPSVVSRGGFAVCLAGHLHAASYEGHVVYPGSPEPLGWGETGRHAAAVVEIEGREVSVEFVEVNARRYAERRVTVEGVGSSAEVAERVAEALAADDHPSGLCLRVSLDGAVPPECEIDIEAIAAAHRDRYAALDVRDLTTPGFDLAAIAAQPAAAGQFVRALQARIAECADGRQRQVLDLALEIGLRALAGQKDVARVD